MMSIHASDTLTGVKDDCAPNAPELLLLLHFLNKQGCAISKLFRLQPQLIHDAASGVVQRPNKLEHIIIPF